MDRLWEYIRIHAVGRGLDLFTVSVIVVVCIYSRKYKFNLEFQGNSNFQWKYKVYFCLTFMNIS